MAAYQKFKAFVEGLAEGVHDFDADSFKFALCNAANPPDLDTDAVLADLTEISYTNLSSRDAVFVSSSAAAGIYSFVLDNLTLTASGGAVAAFQYVVLYNDSAASKNLISMWDNGSEINMADTDEINLIFASSKVFTIE